MNTQACYRTLARYYDSFYSNKDYRTEARIVGTLIAKHKTSSGNALLDVGCGTGNHLQYFRQKFACTGTDVNKGIIDVAGRKLRSVLFRRADMADFRFNTQYDAITCLFGSIAYVKTSSQLHRTIRNMAGHLKTGGVVIIEPWFSKKSYRAGSSFVKCVEDHDTKVVRLTVNRVKGCIAEIDMHFVIAETGKVVQHVVDRHELGLFESAEIMRYMRQAGLQTQLLKKTFPVLPLNGSRVDRGLLVGVKE